VHSGRITEKRHQLDGGHQLCTVEDHVVAQMRVTHLVLELIEASFRDGICDQALLRFPSNISVTIEILLDRGNPKQQVHLGQHRDAQVTIDAFSDLDNLSKRRLGIADERQIDHEGCARVLEQFGRKV
jgi:hypothetical protein